MAIDTDADEEGIAWHIGAGGSDERHRQLQSSNESMQEDLQHNSECMRKERGVAAGRGIVLQ